MTTSTLLGEGAWFFNVRVMEMFENVDTVCYDTGELHMIPSFNIVISESSVQVLKPKCNTFLLLYRLVGLMSCFRYFSALR